jgi:hypothetical protein
MSHSGTLKYNLGNYIQMTNHLLFFPTACDFIVVTEVSM